MIYVLFILQLQMSISHYLDQLIFEKEVLEANMAYICANPYFQFNILFN